MLSKSDNNSNSSFFFDGFFTRKEATSNLRSEPRKKVKLENNHYHKSCNKQTLTEERSEIGNSDQTLEQRTVIDVGWIDKISNYQMIKVPTLYTANNKSGRFDNRSTESESSQNDNEHFGSNSSKNMETFTTSTLN